MLDGQIQSLVTEKGFGFIKPSVSSPDVFFHHSVVDAPLSTLGIGQHVRYELDSKADKPRARCVLTAVGSENSHSSRHKVRPATNHRAFEHGFVTKLNRKTFTGFISSIKHGPEYLFAATSVTGEKQYSWLEIGDYVQFLIAEPDPADPEQPVAKAVKAVGREVNISGGQQLDRHPKSRKKKPTWR